MAVNERVQKDKDNTNSLGSQLNRVSTYFEVLKSKTIQLQLKKDKKFLKDTDLTEKQRRSIKIRTQEGKNSLQKEGSKGKGSKMQSKAAANKQNRDRFIRSFP